MLKLITAAGREFPIIWIGISDIDGSLRFGTGETDFPMLLDIFSDPKETQTLTRVFDGDRLEYVGFTSFKGLESMPDGTTVIRLRHPD